MLEVFFRFLHQSNDEGKNACIHASSFCKKQQTKIDQVNDRVHRTKCDQQKRSRRETGDHFKSTKWETNRNDLNGKGEHYLMKARSVDGVQFCP